MSIGRFIVKVWLECHGEQLRLSANEHEDLFWGVRGSRGNLGVVTAAEIELFGVAELYGGTLQFDGSHLREVKNVSSIRPVQKSGID